MNEEPDLNKNDHRQLGKELGLFVFSDIVGKGLPLWTAKGATIRRELERFIVDEEIRRGYQHVCTPDLAKLELYQKSGHYPYFKDSMYAPIEIDEGKYMLRPMTCPHHFELYLSAPRSYRELPMRIAELAKLYRYEQSGELAGLVRVRCFCLADAHIICQNADEAKNETKLALDLIDFIAAKFKLEQGKDYWYRLSLGDRADDKKYYKDDKTWDEAEAKLREVLQERQAHFVEAANEAAFYGPKIDIQMRDLRGKENTAFTVQFDFVMPKRFKLNYIDANGQEKEAVVIHRSSIGAIERFIAFLIEHYAGNFPLWLSPIQVRILPIGEKHLVYARELKKKLLEFQLRTELDDSGETLGKKIRNAKLAKIPYLIVLGDKEVKENKLTVESRVKGKLENISLEQLITNLTLEIKEKK